MELIKRRLEALRSWMKKNEIDAFVVPSTDPHDGEYVPQHWEARKWISGFTGSAGTFVITISNAAVWTDSRYFIQAEQQLKGTGIRLMKAGLDSTPTIAEYLAKELKPEGRIVIVSQMKNSSTAEEREQGFREGLGELNNNVAEVVYCDSSFDKATELTLKLMAKYPDLSLIAGLNEDSSVGAARAVRDQKAEDRIMVVGVDSSLEAMELMEQGIFRCIVVQEAFKMGYLGVRETISLLSGKAHGLFVDSGCELVTKENMFDPRIEKLIFPFKEDS